MSRRIGQDLRRYLSFFIRCGEFGKYDPPDRALTIWGFQCRRRIWHDGPHDFGFRAADTKGRE